MKGGGITSQIWFWKCGNSEKSGPSLFVLVSQSRGMNDCACPLARVVFVIKITDMAAALHVLVGVSPEAHLHDIISYHVLQLFGYGYMPHTLC